MDFSRGNSMFRMLQRLAARLFRRLPPFAPPLDPYAGVRAPRKHGPRGRDSAVALAEPRSTPLADAIGRVRNSDR